RATSQYLFFFSSRRLHTRCYRDWSSDVCSPISIDYAGNATFSGTFNSQNLNVNQDASISGTLHAHRIIADEIDGTSSANVVNNRSEERRVGKECRYRCQTSI